MKWKKSKGMGLNPFYKRAKNQTDGLIDNESEEKITEEGLKKFICKIIPKRNIVDCVVWGNCG
jgi:hypothetical protein